MSTSSLKGSLDENQHPRDKNGKFITSGSVKDSLKALPQRKAKDVFDVVGTTHTSAQKAIDDLKVTSGKVDMSSDERKALGMFTGGASSAMRAASSAQHAAPDGLKTHAAGQDSPVVRKATDDLHGLVRKHQKDLPEGTTVYRGLTVNDVTAQRILDSVGKHFDVQGAPMSTSVDPAVAQKFGNTYDIKGQHSVVVRITGAQGLPVNGLSSVAGEHEVIMGHDVKLHIDKIERVSYRGMGGARLHTIVVHARHVSNEQILQDKLNKLAGKSKLSPAQLRAFFAKLNGAKYPSGVAGGPL